MRFVWWCLYGISLAASAAERPVIFPAPQQMAVLPAGLALQESVPIVVPANAAAGDMALAREVAAELSDRYGLAMRITRVSALPAGRFILMGAQSNPLVRQYL